jgi:hypothetical protein
VMKENIVFVESERPMERAPKGTAQRGPTIRLYSGELDALYGGPSVLEEKMCETVMNRYVEEKSNLTLNRHAENGKASVRRRGGRIGFFLDEWEEILMRRSQG